MMPTVHFRPQVVVSISERKQETVNNCILQVEGNING